MFKVETTTWFLGGPAGAGSESYVAFSKSPKTAAANVRRGWACKTNICRESGDIMGTPVLSETKTYYNGKLVKVSR